MPLVYRSPGVYLEESLLVNPGQTAGATSTAFFVGLAPKGPFTVSSNTFVGEPVLVESWSSYVSTFGGFDLIEDPDNIGTKVLSYLPYAVYSFFQNGGRSAYVMRSIDGAHPGANASKTAGGYLFTNHATAGDVFTVSAKYAGKWGNNLSYKIIEQERIGAGQDAITDQIFTLQVLLTNSAGTQEIVETFPNLSINATQGGTYRADTRINDLVSGSQYIKITDMVSDHWVSATVSAVTLEDGEEPSINDTLTSGVSTAVEKIDGPILLNIAGYLTDASKENAADWSEYFVGATMSAPASWTDRGDVFVIGDNCPPRNPSQTPAAYKTVMEGNTTLLVNGGDSYTATYGPWLLIADPQNVGQVKAIPPGGAVAGVYARVDATVGVFRAPAGVIAGISNAVGVQTKFTDTALGDLNANNVNVIRSVVGSGISVMGARTRKSYGVDRYVSARRTLIYLREVLKRSTQFALFENNDERLWSALRLTADRVLRGLWQSGGLRGSNTSEAYYINCDASVNTPAVIASGEARMEIGVALEYPAEFIVIRLSQYDRTTITNEITA